MYQRIIKPLLFSLNIERAHHVVLLMLRIFGLIPGGRWLLRKCYAVEHRRSSAKCSACGSPIRRARRRIRP